MNLIYKIVTKNISNKRYLIEYRFSRESNDGPESDDELAGPLPRNLLTEEMQPCWVVQGDGSLIFDPLPLPLAEQLKRELQELQSYLENTDWYVVRKLDNGKPVPIDIAEKREQARNRISEIRLILAELA